MLCLLLHFKSICDRRETELITLPIRVIEESNLFDCLFQPRSLELCIAERIAGASEWISEPIGVNLRSS